MEPQVRTAPQGGPKGASPRSPTPLSQKDFVPAVGNADFPQNFAEPRPRIVVIEHVYHQSPGRDSVGSDTTSSRSCHSDEQPWVRHTRIGGEWAPLDTGFVTDPFLVSVRNDATAFRVNPTEAERSDAGNRVIEVGTSRDDGSFGPFTAIHPGDSVRVYPVEGVRYFLRSRFGFAKVTITAFAG